MTLSIYCSENNKFEQEDITKIIQILSDIELLKFEPLRVLGWCSAYDLTGCRPGYLEFNRSNLSRSRGKDSNCSVDLCSCMTCSFRFNGSN